MWADAGSVIRIIVLRETGDKERYIVRLRGKGGFIMKSLRQLLEIFQTLSTSAQIIVGIVAILMVLGTLALFILAALIPAASVGIINLLSTLGAFAIGRVSSAARGK